MENVPIKTGTKIRGFVDMVGIKSLLSYHEDINIKRAKILNPVSKLCNDQNISMELQFNQEMC